MKTLLFIMLMFVSARAVSAPLTFEQVQTEAALHQKQLQIDGLGYMIGGGLGLLSSLTLGITSEEVIPKLGYSLMQTLSSAAIAYGGIIYFTGDEITQEAQKLRDFSSILGKNLSITPAQKQRILNEAAATFAARSEYYRYRVKKIRGILELTTAAAAASTLALSKQSGSGSNVALGFIFLISLTGGISDLVNAKAPQSAVTASVNVANDSPQFAINYRW